MTLDTIWGIERNPASLSFGELVVPIAYLWNEPAPKEMIVDNLTGAIKHGTDIEVLEEREIDGRLWVLAFVNILHMAKVYPQRGWLRASLLKNAGAAEYA